MPNSLSMYGFVFGMLKDFLDLGWTQKIRTKKMNDMSRVDQKKMLLPKKELLLQ